MACGGSSSNGDEDVDLPGRNGDAGEDAVDAGRDVVQPVFDAGADVVVTSTLCKENDLLLCLPFEGNFVDGSPNAFVPAATDSISFIPGKAGQAASFSQVSALRYAASTLFNQAAVTVEAWIKHDVNNEGVVFDSDTRYAMSVQGTQGHCGAGDNSTTGGSVPVGQWVHLACVFNGTKILLFVNGVQADMDNGKPQQSASGSEAVGGNAPSGTPFIGAIDSLRVFKVARTPEEILAAAK